MPFGEYSAFGVMLVDEEPPWAHASPDTGPGRGGHPQAEFTGSTPDAGHQLTTGDPGGPLLPGILDAAAVELAPGGGTAAPESQERLQLQDADRSNIPIEGIIVLFGTNPGGESTGLVKGPWKRQKRQVALPPVGHLQATSPPAGLRPMVRLMGLLRIPGYHG